MDVEADAALVAACRAGKPGSVAQFVACYEGDLLAVCLRLLRHRQDAEDAVQETFVRAIRSLHRWDGLRPLRPWVMRIGINRARTYLGKRMRRPESAPLAEMLVEDRPNSECTELVRELRLAADALRADYRIVFVLFHEEGWSYEAIADSIERPVGTVKTWLHRAREEVFERLRSRGQIPESMLNP